MCTLFKQAWKLLNLNQTTLFCLISVGYHLESHVVYFILLRMLICTQLKVVASMHNENTMWLNKNGNPLLLKKKTM